MKKYSIALIALIALIVAFHYNFFGIYSRSKVKIDLPDRKIENIQTTSQSTQAKRDAGNDSELLEEDSEELKRLLNGDKKYSKVTYQPLTQKECMSLKEKLGLKYCPYDNDHLAGVAKACGHLKNIPSGENLHYLTKIVYSSKSAFSALDGKRNDSILMRLGIYENSSNIFYWSGEESDDGENGFVRMFAPTTSVPYYAPRNGSGYLTTENKEIGTSKINYGDTRYHQPEKSEKDLTLVNFQNKGTLTAICYK